MVSCESKNTNYLSGAASSRDVFFRCQITCAHKEQVEASKNISCNVHCLKSYPGMLTLLVCHTNIDPMRISLVFKKIILAIFGQGYQRWKYCFFSLFGQGYQPWKFLFFLCHFWPRLPKVKICFSWSLLDKNNNDESFLFWAFLAKVTNRESFVFSWLFLAKDTNGESFGWSWSFLAKDTNGESFCFSWTLLAKVTFIDHFGYEYQWWKLCLWFEILSNLWHPALPNASSCSLEATSGTPLCKQEFTLREATAGMGLQVRVYSYTGRQALA